MTNNPIAEVDGRLVSDRNGRFLPGRPLAVLVAVGLVVLTAVTGCRTPQEDTARQPIPAKAGALVLREGDVLRISFPATPNLDTTQPIRRDGKIVMAMVGEVTAAGLTPAELEKQLLTRYASQLVSKQITVTVVSSSFPVFVTGAVVRPGKIQSDHPLTALEAIMEAGGFDYAKANLGAVKVIRQEGGRTQHFVLNLKSVLDGTQSKSFYLNPSDIVFVPEKFTWF